MRCLKGKIGSGNILDDTPKHLPADEANFTISNIIAGPLQVDPKGVSQFVVTNYEKIKSHFEII